MTDGKDEMSGGGGYKMGRKRNFLGEKAVSYSSINEVADYHPRGGTTTKRGRKFFRKREGIRRLPGLY